MPCQPVGVWRGPHHPENRARGQVRGRRALPDRHGRQCALAFQSGDLGLRVIPGSRVNRPIRSDDIDAASELPRTSTCTCRAERLRNIAACPAELPPPITTTTLSRQ